MKRLAKIFLFFVAFRYQITVKGFEHIRKNQSYLVLPNHISLLEPMIIFSLFSSKIMLRPVMTSLFAKNPFLGRFFKRIQAIAVDESETTETKVLAQSLQTSLSQLKQALQNGESLLLYPSGQLAGQGFEYLGGKKSAYLAVKAAPETTRILAVRVSGLRGSIWSNARTGERPHFMLNILKAFWFFLANGFFFAPKRKVTIEILDQTEYLRQQAEGELASFNQALESFYNQHGEEKLSYLPHYFYLNDVKSKKLPSRIKNSVCELKKTDAYDKSKFLPETIEFVCSEIKKIKNLNAEIDLALDQHLILDLYLDSLDMAEIKNLLLSTYPHASNTPILDLKTVADLVAMAQGLTPVVHDELKPCEWTAVNPSQTWFLDPEKNILEHFKYQWKQDKSASMVYDAMFGLQNRKDIALKSLLISQYLKDIEGKNIGIMMPAVASTSILLLATYLAEKIPVMINRTHPQAAFDHCVKFSKTKKILTSKAFFSKINIPRLQEYDFVFLEDLLKDIPLSRKLSAWIRSLSFPIPAQLDEIAVVLYTSGSESLPKAVPLTHKNIISNLSGALGILDIQHDERLLGYLPPFHSFGFTVNTVLPLVAGLGLVNTPDPNDSLTVAKMISHTQPTLLATTPTFLRNLLNIASSDQLSSLRYVITGGEKCPESLFEKAKKLIPSAVILEGYGITECSPIITINTLQKQKKQSTGIAISNAEVRILDLSSLQSKAANQEGMILVSAPSVFAGYQDHNLPSPFISYEEKLWYKTGDLGYLDPEGYLYITGREKRFLKLGGEMISLPFIEELLASKYGSSESANLAIEGKETETGVHIVLFTVDLDLDLSKVNAYLRSQGVSNLIAIDEIRPIGALPLLGSGKIDYKILKNQC